MKDNYILKLAFKNLRFNKRLTKLNSLALLLNTTILFVSLVLCINIFQISSPKDNHGNFHYTLTTSDNFDLPLQYTVTKDMNTSYSTNIEQGVYELHSLSNNLVLPFQVIEGTIPQSSNEIMVPSDLNVGLNEWIELEIIHQETMTNEFKTYQVVGIYEKNSLFNQSYLYIEEEVGSICHYYIRDDYFYVSSSVDGLIELVNNDNIVINQAFITAEKLEMYLQNTKMIYVLFLMIILLDSLITYISLKNIVTIYAHSRRKEIGLLKSIGASTKQIKRMFQYESIILGLINAIVGIVIGTIISLIILQSICKNIFIPLNYSMVIHPTLWLISLFSCIVISLIAGINSQKNTIYSLPIDDLKEMSFEYPTPIHTKSSNANKFPWHMFLIYNQRLRTHTSNVRQSFLLIILCTLMLVCIIFSNHTYKKSEIIDEYDILLTNNTYNDSYTTLYLDFVYALYDEYDNGSINIDYVSVERKENTQILTPTTMYAFDFISSKKNSTHTSMFIGVDQENLEWCNFYQYPTILDEYQLNALQPYIKDGKLENLDENNYVIILWGGNSNTDHAAIMSRASQGFSIAEYKGSSKNLKKYVNSSILKNQNKNIEAVAKLPLQNNEVRTPDTVLYQLHLPLKNADYTIARSYKTLENGNLFEGTETIKIKLENSSLTYQFEKHLQELIKDYNVTHVYDIEYGPANNDKIKMTILLIDVLFLPLCALLFVITLFNMMNVLNGNSIIKKNDFNILHLIGMTHKQAGTILFYEYVEGYFNASIIATILVAVISILSQHLDYFPILNLTSNLTSSLIATVLFITPMILLPYILIKIYK